MSVGLYDYQHAMVRRHVALLSARYVTADRSETGTGKTPVILAAIAAREEHFIVVCPKSVKTHWRLWVAELDLEDRCLATLGWEEAKLGLYRGLYDGENWPSPNQMGRRLIIVFDEAHRAKNYKTQNSKMVRRAREQGHLIALLSATLIQSPLDLGGLAYPLGLIAHRRFWFPFAQQYGAYLNRWRGYDDGATRAQREALHRLLDKVSVRVRKADVAPSMCINQVDLIDAGNLETIRGCYDEMEAEIAELHIKEANAAQILTARLHGRQAVELAKVNLFVDLAKEHLDQGAKVALFFNFTKSVEYAQRAFNEMRLASARITGQTSQLERDAAIAAFNGEAIDVLVLNIAAGGEGINLHDATGNKPRVCLLSPPESATVLTQALGRVDRVGSKSVALNRVIFVADTIEETVYRNVRRKIRNLSVLNDGDLRFDLPVEVAA